MTDATPSTATLTRAAIKPSPAAHLRTVQALARHLMDHHGLNFWQFRWDNATRRAGGCMHARMTLTFSRKVMAGWTVDACQTTILHEIAHALTPGHGHDATWQRCCREIGGDGQRCWEATEDRPLPAMPWVGTCPGGHEHGRTRQPTKTQSCGQCSRRFNPAYKITWTRRSA